MKFIRLIKQIITKNFSNFFYFYQHLGYRIFLSLVLSFSVGLLDGFGLAMFLPLLQMVTGDAEAASTDGMGGMEFVVEGLESLGISMTLESVLLIITVFFSLKGVAFFTRQYYNVVVKSYFIKELRFRNISGLANYQYKAFVLSDSGRIQNTLSGEIERVNYAFFHYFNTLQAVMMMLVYMAMAFVTNPHFAVLVVIGGLLSNVAYRQIYKRTKAVSAKITHGGHLFQRQLIQFVGHYKYLKSTAALQLYSEKLKDSVAYIEESNKKIGFYNSLLSATREPLNIAVVAAVILSQVYFFSAALSGIILALLFFYRALTYVMSFQTSWNNFLNVTGSLENMTAFMRDLDADEEVYGKSTKDHFRGEIELKDVSFNYGDTPILKNISMQIPANTSVALVGESGSGKTTLVNLVSGLMRPDRGAIYVDDINYTDLDIRSLQKHIGYISQDPVIFSESIFDNVTLWAAPTAENIARFWQACEKAAIAEFIRSLPNGMETELGNNGIQVSGGQKQRLSIARELYKDVSILIMDEATSALDSNVEREIQENIDALMGNFTIVIIAHRLSTIRNVDKVVLMDSGRVTDVGTFDDLIRENKYFRNAVNHQSL